MTPVKAIMILVMTLFSAVFLVLLVVRKFVVFGHATAARCAALAADLGHMAAVGAHRLAAFAAYL